MRAVSSKSGADFAESKTPAVETSGFGGIMDSFRQNGQFSEIPRVKIPKIWVLPKSGFTFPKSNFTIPEARSCARGFLPRKSGGSGSPRFRAGRSLAFPPCGGGRCKNEQLFIFLLTAHFPRALILRVFQPTESYELDLSISRGRLRDRVGGRPQIFARVYEACPVGGDDFIHAFQRRGCWLSRCAICRWACRMRSGRA